MSQIEIFTAAQVLDSGIKIPSPPTLLTELNSLLDAPDVDIGKLAALISRDAGAVIPPKNHCCQK
jgi:HD-like signal output (HDOD) protein